MPHELQTTESGQIKVGTTTLAGVAVGIHSDSAQTISGAVGTLDFAGKATKRFTVTGNLSGAFTFPPSNVPALGTDGDRVTLEIEFIQDGTGGRQMDLSALFVGANKRVGVSAPDLAANGVTVVLLELRRASGAVTYTAHLSPTVDGVQITGTIPAARVQAGAVGQVGVLALGPGSGAAAPGNHVHVFRESKAFRLRMSDGSALVAGDYDIVEDLNTAGTLVRLTKVKLHGGTTPTATVTAKIDTTAVSGISIAATGSPSADDDATGANAFTARQALKLTLASVTGSPTMVSGVAHINHTGEPAA